MNMRWTQQQLVVQCITAGLYFLVGLITLEYAVLEDNRIIAWLPSGFALAVLMMMGLRYSLGVFIGAFAVGLHMSNPYFAAGLVALANTLGPAIVIYLLGLLPFSKNFTRLDDYLSFALAASLGALAYAFLATLSGAMAGFTSFSSVWFSVFTYWLSDLSGILLLSPLLLLFSYQTLSRKVASYPVELLFLMTMASLLWFAIVNDWAFGLVTGQVWGYFLVLPLVWSVSRFGQVVTGLLVLEYFVFGLTFWQTKLSSTMAVQLETSALLFSGGFVFLSLVCMSGCHFFDRQRVFYQTVKQGQEGAYTFSDGLYFNFANNTVLEALGLTSREVVNHQITALMPLYNEEQLATKLAPLFSRQCDFINFETLIRSKGGRCYSAEIQIRPVLGSDLRQYFATVKNNEDGSKNEQHLDLGNQACEHSSQAILVMNKANEIIRVNKAFTEITGYQKNDVLGKDVNILSCEQSDDSFSQKLSSRLQFGDYWQGELYTRRKNGEAYTQSISANVLKDEQGEHENYVVTFTDRTKEQEQMLHFKRLAEIDTLTNLPNRILLQQDFQFALASAKRNNKKLGLLFIDLNDFKPINDAYGHDTGDKVLQEIADRMKRCIRETDTVPRVGGDEFVLLISNIDMNTNGVCLAMTEKLKAEITKPIEVKGVTVQITASIGSARFPGNGDTLEALLDFADSSMYRDKEKMKQA